MPNYRLGPLDGSSCDTLGIDNVPVAYFRVDDSLGKRSRFFYDLSYYEPAQWLWDFGDGAQDTAQNALHTYKKAGYYNVCLTVKNTNGSNTSCRWITIDTLTSSSTSPEMAELRVWPNPAQDFITVQVQENTTGHWLLHDLSGRLMVSGLWAGTQQQIDVSGLISGFYVFALVEQTGVRRVGKFAVLRRE